jgi:hypothetical protein
VYPNIGVGSFLDHRRFWRITLSKICHDPSSMDTEKGKGQLHLDSNGYSHGLQHTSLVLTRAVVLATPSGQLPIFECTEFIQNRSALPINPSTPFRKSNGAEYLHLLPRGAEERGFSKNKMEVLISIAKDLKGDDRQKSREAPLFFCNGAYPYLFIEQAFSGHHQMKGKALVVGQERQPWKRGYRSRSVWAPYHTTATGSPVL